MIYHFFKIAFRNIIRNKTVSLINILGLAIGMGAFLLILQYLQFEFSFDRFHKEGLYRITQSDINNKAHQNGTIHFTYGLGPMAVQEIPELQDYIRIHPHYEGPVVNNPEQNKPYQENALWYVDSNFLEHFNFELIYGASSHLLSNKQSVVITQKLAEKYFGKIDPTGKILNFHLGNLSGDFVVTGVLKTIPANSHMDFDLLVPMDFLLENYSAYDKESGWEWRNFITYFLLKPGVSLKDAENKFDQLILAHDQNHDNTMKLKTNLQPVPDIHLSSSHLDDSTVSNKSKEKLYYIAIIAVFILLMAVINYVNMAITQSIQREKEIGIRKTIGASKLQVKYQFFTETTLLYLLAFGIAILTSHLGLPFLNQLLGLNLVMELYTLPEVWAGLIVLLLLIIFLSGFYPGIVVSSLKPIGIFKLHAQTPKSSLGLRKVLTVFQFFISLMLISATYLVYQQVSYMKSKDLGVDMEHIVVVEGPRVMDYENLEVNYGAFKQLATKHHSVLAASASGTVPGKGNMWRGEATKVGDPSVGSHYINSEQVDRDFHETYNLDLLAGDTLSIKAIGENRIIINKEAAFVFGFSDPQDAINEELAVWAGESMNLKIVGVVDNFHWSSLKEAHMPYMFFLNNEYGAYFSFRISGENLTESLQFIQSSFETVFPGNPFDYFFLDQNFHQQYHSELHYGKLFTIFSALAIFIACLGLFALVSFTIGVKTKELGIRKIMGASIGSLLGLLSKEYIFILLIAAIIGSPLVWFGANLWLDNYAYKVDLGLSIILLPFLLLLGISLLIVIAKTYKALLKNPVDSLRND